MVLLNSFIDSDDFDEINKFLSFCKNFEHGQTSVPTFIFSENVSDNTQLSKFLSRHNGIKINSNVCSNIRFYNHVNLSDISKIMYTFEDTFVLNVENPKKCSLKNDILDSIYNTQNRTSINIKKLLTQYNNSPSKFDILVNAFDYSSYRDDKFVKQFDKLKSSKNIEMNTNNDEYSKYMNMIRIYRIYGQSDKTSGFL